MVVGIKDIATYVGLSTSTVSRALNGYDDVAVETVEHVNEPLKSWVTTQAPLPATFAVNALIRSVWPCCSIPHLRRSTSSLLN